MDWRRGLFRFWVAASLFWAAFAGWITYDRYATAKDRAASQTACFEKRKADPSLGNPFECFVGGMEFDDLLPLAGRLREFAIIALPPVVGSFVLGAAFLWVVAGFKLRKP